jgi:hypothetical protein
VGLPARTTYSKDPDVARDTRVYPVYIKAWKQLTALEAGGRASAAAATAIVLIKQETAKKAVEEAALLEDL